MCFWTSCRRAAYRAASSSHFYNFTSTPVTTKLVFALSWYTVFLLMWTSKVSRLLFLYDGFDIDLMILLWFFSVHHHSKQKEIDYYAKIALRKTIFQKRSHVICIPWRFTFFGEGSKRVELCEWCVNEHDNKNCSKVLI